MFRRIHDKLGTAGFIISIVALIAALSGGAYAASGGLTGKQKKEVEKIAKKYSGTSGAAGPAGPTGATGPAGTAGPAGAMGAAGTNGTNGTNGKNGTNGTTGFTDTLPGGKTETGAWALGILPSLPAPIWKVPISFAIPLSEGIQASECNTAVAGPPSHVATTCTVHFIAKTGKERVGNQLMDETVCTGSAAAPTAPPGNLCVYEATSEHMSLSSGGIVSLTSLETEGTSTAGAMLNIGEVVEEATGWGTWAVTAEEE